MILALILAAAAASHAEPQPPAKPLPLPSARAVMDLQLALRQPPEETPGMSGEEARRLYERYLKSLESPPEVQAPSSFQGARSSR